MSIAAFNSIIELVRAFPNEKTCIEYCEKHRWASGVVSPFDPTSKVYNYGNHKYRCKNTGKNFTVKTNTLFHDSKVSLQKWFVAIWLINNHKKGISSIHLSKEIAVTQKTAWFMLHRIRKCYFCENNGVLGGEVEMDETFVGGKNKNRHRNKKVKNSQGRSFKDKTPVLGMLERGGKLVCRVMTDTSYKQITKHVLRHVNRNAKVFTDEWGGYRLVSKVFRGNHFVVDHGKGLYVSGNATTNRIEGVWGILKRGIIGIYNYTSRKHLQHYANEFAFRFNTRSVTDSERFSLFLCNTEHRLTYKQLTNG